VVSLASYRTVVITAINLADGRENLRGIAHLRWEGDDGAAEESSVEDFIRWLDRVEGRAYVRLPNGARGPQVDVVGAGSQRHLRSDPYDETTDALLTLPRLRPVAPAQRTPAHRRGGRQAGSLR
jgi:hypothetical protein